uniref:Uncharacterized protein n=1 Tax=Cucumis sativus TaxID=3659 RepID=A0A0A0KN77_CUCSA
MKRSSIVFPSCFLTLQGSSISSSLLLSTFLSDNKSVGVTLVNIVMNRPHLFSLSVIVRSRALSNILLLNWKWVIALNFRRVDWFLPHKFDHILRGNGVYWCTRGCNTAQIQVQWC